MFLPSPQGVPGEQTSRWGSVLYEIESSMQTESGFPSVLAHPFQPPGPSRQSFVYLKVLSLQAVWGDSPTFAIIPADCVDAVRA